MKLSTFFTCCFSNNSPGETTQAPSHTVPKNPAPTTIWYNNFGKEPELTTLDQKLGSKSSPAKPRYRLRALFTRVLGGSSAKNSDNSCKKSQVGEHGALPDINAHHTSEEIPTAQYQAPSSPLANIEILPDVQFHALIQETGLAGKQSLSAAQGMNSEAPGKFEAHTARRTATRTEQLLNMADNIDTVHECPDQARVVTDKVKKNRVVRLFNKDRLSQRKYLSTQKTLRKQVDARAALRAKQAKGICLDDIQYQERLHGGARRLGAEILIRRKPMSSRKVRQCPSSGEQC